MCVRVVCVLCGCACVYMCVSVCPCACGVYIFVPGLRLNVPHLTGSGGWKAIKEYIKSRDRLAKLWQAVHASPHAAVGHAGPHAHPPPPVAVSRPLAVEVPHVADRSSF